MNSSATTCLGPNDLSNSSVKGAVSGDFWAVTRRVLPDRREVITPVCAARSTCRLALETAPPTRCASSVSVPPRSGLRRMSVSNCACKRERSRENEVAPPFAYLCIPCEIPKGCVWPNCFAVVAVRQRHPCRRWVEPGSATLQQWPKGGGVSNRCVSWPQCSLRLALHYRLPRSRPVTPLILQIRAR